MIVAPYIRVSTQEQVEHGYSIEEQSKRTKKYCESMGWNIYKVYSDPGYSGGNTDRPGLKMLIDDVKAGKIDKVLVYKLDRLSRSQLDTLYLIEKVFLANNTDFVSMSENFDTSTPFGRAMIGILAVFAQLEREQIRERMQMGKEARAKQGKFHGSNIIPIGYDYIDGELKTNEYEKMQIQTIFDLYSKGKGGRYIADYMKDHGYQHKYGAWSEVQIRRVVKNKTYIGYLPHRGEWFKGSHEAFIDESFFDGVQNMVEKRTRDHLKYNRRPGKVTTYLGGLLFCERCGAKYHKVSRKSKHKDGSFRRFEKYECNSRTKKHAHLVKDPNCKNKIWNVEELDNIVFDEIKKLSFDNSLIRKTEPDHREDILTAEIEKINARLDHYIELYSVDGIPLDSLKEKIKKLDLQKEQLKKELDRLSAEPDLDSEKAIEIVNSFEDVLKNGDFQMIRELLSELIEKIELNGDDMTIFWRFN